MNRTTTHAALPQHKQDNLADRVADTIFEGVKKHYQDFRDHEVSREDSTSIVERGVKKAGQRWNDFNKDAK